MKDRFKANLDKMLVAGGSGHTILAVSGGIDSVVMAWLFSTTKRPFSIAHCNFQLRGEESVQDETFVNALAEELSVAIDIKRFNTTSYADEYGISIQMAARELRYEWFNTLIEGKRAKIATAHHANDVAETLLFNLAKGTGLAGLHGIAAQDDRLIRPLLWAKRVEIEEYAKQENIKWREDQSNESEKYMRNIIRKKVIPELARINPSFVEATMKTAARVRENEAFIKYAIEQLDLVEVQGSTISIKKTGLAGIPGNKAVLYQLLKPYGFSHDQANAIAQSLNSTGAVFYAKEWLLNIDRTHLILGRSETNAVDMLIAKDDEIIELPGGKLSIGLHDTEGFSIPKEKEIAVLDLDKLIFPLQLRNWQQGDYFVPLGMQGKKKISDFMIDEKIPVAMKSNLLVLVSGDEIVWVVGYRINDHYKITAHTQRIYQIAWQ